MDNDSQEYQDFLQKKGSKGNWTTYWVCLEGNNLLFYEEKKTDKLFGSVELGKHAKCIVTQRKAHSYRFMVTALHGRHLFKCQSAAQRHRWITGIQRAVQNLSESLVIPKNPSESCETRTTSPEKENVSVDENDVLPLNVILVTSFPALSESPTHPFRVARSVARSSENGDELENHLHSSSKGNPELYLFTREPAEEGAWKSPGSRREGDRNILDLGTPSPFCDSDPRCQRLSPRQNRSFPCTPEKGERSPKNSLDFMTSGLAKSRSLNFLQDDSSPVPASKNVRFSRHMVKGGSVGDVEL